jgi:hypothetical protein
LAQAKVADLPVEVDGETAEEFLVSNRAFAKKVFEDMQTEDFDPAFTVVPATDENLAKAEAQLEKGASSVVAPPRPSLEVETEVHDNLRPRIDAHLGRMRAWDLRKLDIGYQSRFRDAIDRSEAAFKDIGSTLAMLSREGFVAKTTPVTRLASKLTQGARVSLRDDQLAIFAKVYTEEQLDTLFVAKVSDTHVQLMADDGSNLGLVRIIHVVLKP